MNIQYNLVAAQLFSINNVSDNYNAPNNSILFASFLNVEVET